MYSLAIFMLTFSSILVDAKLTLPLKKHPSIRSQLEREGKWGEFHQRLIRSRPKSKIVQTAPLNDYFNDFFTHEVTFGTPPQTLILRPDTSMSDLWVMDKNKCTADQCNGFQSLTSNYNRTLFNATASYTYSASNMNFSSGACFSGMLSGDQFSMAGFTLINQQFGLCYDVDKFMGLHPFDGYLGLAWPSLATDGVVPVMQNLIASGNLDKPVFSVYLVNDNGRAITSGVANAGAITYGGVDTTNCASSISYVPLSSTTYWQFTMSSFTFGSYSVSKSQQAIVTTAEAIIIVPDSTLQQIVTITEAIPFPIIDGAQYIVNCSYAPTFPSLTFTIGGQNYMVPGPSYVDALPAPLAGMCALRIQNPSGFSYGPQWILGTPFMRNYCVHHDIGNSQVGFSRPIKMH